MEQQMLADRQRARRTIASYATYAEAQRAVDYLADQKFAVERVAIFAEGLRFVEQVTGRLGYGKAALNGALSGAVTGGFLGYLLGLFSLITPLTSALALGLYGLIFGAIIGAIIGLIGHALSGGRRDFSSTSGLQAESYNVMVDDDLADEAARLLASMAGPALAAERAGAQGQAV